MATEWTAFPSACAVYFVIVNIDLTHEPSKAPKNIGFFFERVCIFTVRLINNLQNMNRELAVETFKCHMSETKYRISK